MVVGHVPEAVDFVVAGAGPGGYAAALRAAQAGRRVTLVDSEGADGLGGVCLRTGCIPSKALIEAADLKHRIETQPMGLSAARAGFDPQRFQGDKQRIIDRLTAGVGGLLRKAGVEVIAGTLSLTDPQTAVINLNDGNVQVLSFESLVLATGSSTVELENVPFDGVRVLDSTHLLALEALPATIAVIGAGYIGVELGTALAKLGVSVTVLDMESRVLPAMDPVVSKVVQQRMRALGISFLAETRGSGFEPGRLEVECADGARRSVSAEQVLVAVGRRPNSHGIGLGELDVQMDNQGVIYVNDDMTISPRIAAIGDLTPGPALAHKATAQAEVAVDALCGKQAEFDATAIPEVVFCDPQVAVAGLSLDQARRRGLDADIANFPLSASGRGATLGTRDGFTQIVFDRDDGAVLGVHMAGPNASDRIAEAVLAIELGAGIEDLALTIHPHPSLSETLGEAAHIAMGRPLHFGASAG